MYPNETMWNITLDGALILENDEMTEVNTTYVVSECIPNSKCYLFTIYDTYGDGLSEGGYYSVFYDGVLMSPTESFFAYQEMIFLGGDSCNTYTFPPTNSPVVGTLAPTPALEPCASSETRISVIINTDDHPFEISWNVIDVDGGVVFESEEMIFSNTTYRRTKCVPSVDCFLFTIYDDYGDGLTGQGNYSVLWDATEESPGRPFEFQESFYVGGSTCDSYTLPPAPTPATLEPTNQITPCLETESRISVIVATDEYPHETSWEVVDLDGVTILINDEMSLPFTTYRQSQCVPATVCYLFTIYDEYGDGISDTGSFSVLWDNEVESPSTPFNFQQQFYVGGSDCDSLTVSPTETPQELTYAPTAPIEPCYDSQSRVVVKVYTDSYPSENWWEIKNKFGKVKLENDPFVEPDYRYTKSACLWNTQCYVFSIYDSYGDGMFTEPSYSVTWDGKELSRNASWEFEQNLYIGDPTYCDSFTQWPTFSPTTTSFPTAGVKTYLPTPEPEPCSEDSSKLVVVVFTDDFPEETSWKIQSDDGSILYESEQYTLLNYRYTSSYCLPKSSCYNFTISDSYGDGLFSFNGYYLIWNDERIQDGDQEWEFEQTTYFGGDGCDVCGPGKKLVTLELQTDDYGGETFWVSRVCFS